MAKRAHFVCLPRFREMLLWDDPPDYYESEAGFVFFHPDVPRQLLEASVPPRPNGLTPEETGESAALSG